MDFSYQKKDCCYIEATIGQKKGHGAREKGMALQEKGMAQRHAKRA